MRSVFNWNHISNDLTEDKISEFKALYKHYHQLFKCYQWKYKKLRRLKLALEISSISLTVAGTITGTVTLNPIVIGCVAGPGVIIQGYLTKSDLIQRVDRCRFAYTSYEKILVQLRNFMRGALYHENLFLSDAKVIDETVIDNCPSVDSLYDKYKKSLLVNIYYICYAFPILLIQC